MYVVTSNGKKLLVDDSCISEDEYFPFQQTVGLYSDNTVLKEIYLVTGQRRNNFSISRKDDDLEFVAQRVYEHKPTEEEILWFMSANGLSRYDIVTVDKAYTLDME